MNHRDSMLHRKQSDLLPMQCIASLQNVTANTVGIVAQVVDATRT
jgi:hypothetical protein